MISSKITDISLVAQLAELRLEFSQLFNSDNPVSPSDYSEIAVKMATLNSMLGDHVTARKKLQFEREKEVWKQCQEEKLSATATDARIRQESAQARLNFEMIDTNHKDYWKLINTIQTHVSAEKDERKSG